MRFKFQVDRKKKEWFLHSAQDAQQEESVKKQGERSHRSFWKAVDKICSVTWHHSN